MTTVSRPLVSIIVPIYNVEKYLAKCLDSLVTQSYPNVEILAVNDGSLDGSASIVETYQKSYPSIRLLNKQNGGLSDARNYGIEHARGLLLMFIDSDDYINPTMVEKLVNALETHRADIAVCDMTYVYDNGDEKYSSGGQFIVTDIHQDPTLFKINNSACNKIFKSELFKDNLFVKGIWYEDLATIPKCIYYAEKIVKINEALYYYVQRENSIIHSENKKIFDIYIALEGLIEFIKKNNDYGRFKPVLKQMAIIQGVELTNLRIKEFKQNIQPYFEMNHNRINALFPNWYFDSIVWTSGLKRWVGFTLFYLKQFKLLKTLYKRSG